MISDSMIWGLATLRPYRVFDFQGSVNGGFQKGGLSFMWGTEIPLTPV